MLIDPPKEQAPARLLISCFTSNATLTKVFCVDSNGEVKKTSAANMYEGTCQVVEFDGMRQFAEFLPTLNERQALTYGVPKSGEKALQVITKKARADVPLARTVMARTTDDMGWHPGPGIMCLDYDPSKGGSALSRDQLLDTLYRVAPTLFQCGFVWWVSSSSNIYQGEAELYGMRGQRVYIGVQDARDIARAGKLLADLLWLAGYGHYEISRSGALLERTLIDTSMWQPNKFDFAAGAKCAPPLSQNRGEPYVYDGDGFLDSFVALPDLTPEQEMQLERLKADKRAALKPEIDKAKVEYVTEQVKALAAKNPERTPEELTETVQRAVETRVLMGDFEIQLDSGVLVKVSDILSDREKYHHAKCYDPLEPEYDGHRVVGKLYLDRARPVLVSQAHGKRTFKLSRLPARLEFVTGKLADLVDTVCGRLKVAPDVFDYGNKLVVVADGKMHVLDEHGLRYYLGCDAQYWKPTPTEKDPDRTSDIDPPKDLALMLLARGETRGLKKLAGVTTAPTMRADYSIIDRPGYDSETMLYYSPDGDVPRVPLNPTYAEFLTAFNYLWAPFSEFPFIGPEDRGAYLSALFSSVVRAGIPTSPAHALDAPSPGSGKTLLALCASIIAGGVPGKVMPPVSARSGEDEIRKRLLAMLLSGDVGNFAAFQEATKGKQIEPRHAEVSEPDLSRQSFPPINVSTPISGGK